MLRTSISVTIFLAIAGSSAALAQQVTWLDTIVGVGTPHGSYGHRAGGACDIVVKRPGGNPTQDMTGTIGHAKSYRSNGGPARERICR